MLFSFEKLFSILKRYDKQIASAGVLLTIAWGIHVYLVDQATATANKLQTDAETKLENSLAEQKTLGEKIDALSAEVDGLSSALDVADSTNVQLALNGENLQSRLNEATASLSRLEVSLQEKSNQYDLLTERYSNERERSRERLFELLDANLELAQIRLEIGVLRNQLAAYQSTLANQVEGNHSEQIERLNEGLQLFRLVRWPIIIRDWNIDSAYLITRKDGAFGDELPYSLVSFEPYKYVLAEGFQCLADIELCTDICSLIDQAALNFLDQASAEYLDALSKIGNTEDGKTFDQAAIAEVTAIYRVIEGISERTHLMLRGLSDGQTDPWTRPLDNQYLFDSIAYLGVDDETCVGSNLNCWGFDREQKFNAPDPYSNNHLANLRAQYFEANISSVLASCNSEVVVPEITLLEGIDDLRLAGAASTDVRTVVGVIVIGEQVSR